MIAWGVAAFFMIVAAILAYLHFTQKKDKCPEATSCPPCVGGVGITASGDAVGDALAQKVGIPEGFREFFTAAESEESGQSMSGVLSKWSKARAPITIRSRYTDNEISCLDPQCDEQTIIPGDTTEVDLPTIADMGKIRIIKMNDQYYSIIFKITLDQFKRVLTALYTLGKQGGQNELARYQEDYEQLKNILSLIEITTSINQLIGFDWRENTFRLSFPVKKIGESGDTIKFMYNANAIKRLNPREPRAWKEQRIESLRSQIRMLEEGPRHMSYDDKIPRYDNYSSQEEQAIPLPTPMTTPVPIPKYK